MLLERAKSLLLLVDMQERLVPVMADAADLTARCGILLRAAYELGVPILASEQYPKGLGATIPSLAAFATRRLEKMEFSAYANNAIKDELTRAGQKQIILAGIEAHVCVLQTGLELVAAGFQVFVVADAVASRRPESREVALHRVARAGATLITAEMALFEWLRSASAPEFRAISQLIR
ncbi:hydrolase [Dongia sedimenti]|uniref:Hydrolase n=1 Tax=Dongia sedimenti TaxID=3064282 RepID=A0ABU0YUY4_9PROT|nr:hydrolase [Rhodospirillaceae bacterium R-7]